MGEPSPEWASSFQAVIDRYAQQSHAALADALVRLRTGAEGGEPVPC